MSDDQRKLTSDRMKKYLDSKIAVDNKTEEPFPLKLLIISPV